MLPAEVLVRLGLLLSALSLVCYYYYGFFPLWRFSHTEGVIAIDFESIRREARGSSILILETLSSLPIRFRVSREPNLDPSLYDTLSNLLGNFIDRDVEL